MKSVTAAFVVSSLIAGAAAASPRYAGGSAVAAIDSRRQPARSAPGTSGSSRAARAPQPSSAPLVRVTGSVSSDRVAAVQTALDSAATLGVRMPARVSIYASGQPTATTFTRGRDGSSIPAMVQLGDGFSPAELRFVTLHEITHVLRQDSPGIPARVRELAADRGAGWLLARCGAAESQVGVACALVRRINSPDYPPATDRERAVRSGYDAGRRGDPLGALIR